MSDPTLQAHRSAWARKPALRWVYREYFKQVLRCCSPHRPIVELGSGPGMFREFYPESIATDILQTRWTDVVCDAVNMPFAPESVGNLVMIDVFHHLSRPGKVLMDASRVLKPGGKIVMIEPWTSWFGYRFYRYIHHEQADYRVDAASPFREQKDPFDGNAVLPRLYFDKGRKGAREWLSTLGFTVTSAEPFPAISWLLTGGFRHVGMGRRRDIPTLGALESILQPFRQWLSLRALLVVEKSKQPAPASVVPPPIELPERNLQLA